MNELYIVRHGETEWNAERRMQGRLDSPLNEAGRGHAEVNGQALAALGSVDYALVSPSGRTQETMHILNSHLNIRYELEERLMERDCGLWGGFTVDEIAANEPEAWAEREADPYYARPPGGENLPDMLLRAQPLLDTLIDREEERLLLVTHGVMSRVVLTYFLGLNEVEAIRVRHPNDLFYRLTFTESGVFPDFYRAGVGPVSGLLRAEVDASVKPFSSADPQPSE